jgi:hypothetical protein
MSDSHASYHEPSEALTRETLELHRALVSLQEELEAVDWYRQRIDACGDPQLREILAHNMREEIEHASMLLAWLQGHNVDFATQLETYLISGNGNEALEAELHDAPAEQTASNATEEAYPEGPDEATPLNPYRFTIGSLKEAK